MRSRITPALCLASACLAGPLSAQFTQYTAPGSLAVAEESRAEQAQERAERARWSFGKLRIAPEIGLRDVAWVSNVYDASDRSGNDVSDVTGTAEAGLEALSYLGPDVLFSIHGRPSYTYWQDQDQLRQSHLSYGAGLFGLHNRLTWELSGEHDERQSFANDELRIPLDLETDRLTAQAWIDFWGPLGLFVRAEELEAGYPARTPEGAAEVDLTSLDRSESLLAGGLFYQPREGMRIGVGLERSEVDFDVDPGGRSNRATSPYLSVRLPGNRVELDLVAVQRRLEFDDPELGSRDELTGRGRVTWLPGSRSDLSLFAGRNVVYSALDDSSYFTSGVFGGQLGWGSRREREGLRVALLAETGTDRFTGATGELADRRDDILNYGITLSLPYRQLLVFQIGVIQSEIDSNLDDFDRSYTQVRTALRLQPLGPLQ